MARPYTVELPGGGAITVNASDPDAARENAGVGSDAKVVAGGHQAHQESGTAVMNSGNENYAQPEVGPGSVYATGSTGTNATANPAAGGSAAALAASASPGSVYGYEAPGNSTTGGTAEDQTRSIYGRRGNERMDAYMRRVMQQATRANNPALNPYSDENPNANSPYARWFQERYGDVVPANAMIARLLGNNAEGMQFDPYMEQYLGKFVGGEGRGFAPWSSAVNNLTDINSIVTQLQAGNQDGLSADQRLFGQTIKDDPRMGTMLIKAQLDGQVNPFGMDYFNTLAEDMTANYYDDPVGNAPDKKGPYFSRFLKAIGMA